MKTRTIFNKSKVMTLPWLPDEYMIVDGIRAVYSYQKDRILVHLPGCITETIESLRSRGRVVKMPRLMRPED